MSSLERAMVRHIARTAYNSRVRRFGTARAEMEARAQATAFIADLQDAEWQALLQLDLDEFLAEQKAK